MRLRTANHNARRRRRRAVYLAAFAFHQKRVERLAKSGRLDRLKDSGYARRYRKRVRTRTDHVVLGLDYGVTEAVVLGTWESLQ